MSNSKENRSFWDKSKHFINNALQKTKTLIAAKKNTISESESLKSDKSFEQLMDNFHLENNENKESYNLNSELKSKINNAASLFWNIGNVDGKLGQTSRHIPNVAEAYVLHIKDHIIATYSGKIASLKSKNEIETNLKAESKKEYEEALEYKYYIESLFRQKPNNFSRVLLILYLIIAILLIFADIPLALNLTSNGFDLQGNTKLIKDLFTPESGDFIINSRALAENWEVFILATGIALCTVIIKILYDEYINHPLEKQVKQFKFHNFTPTAKEMKSIMKAYWFRVLIKSLALILTFSTIISLGFFRFETTKFLRQEQMNSGEIISAQPDEFITKLTFILITLLFPIVGGICLSLSLNILSNRQAQRRADKNTKLLEKKYLTTLDNYNITHSEFTDLNELQNLCKEDSFRDKYYNFFISCYHHGNERGRMIVNIDEDDLYAQAEKFRQKLTNSDINSLLTKPKYSLNGNQNS